MKPSLIFKLYREKKRWRGALESVCCSVMLDYIQNGTVRTDGENIIVSRAEHMGFKGLPIKYCPECGSQIITLKES